MESIDEKAKLINEADLSAHKNIVDKNARRLQHEQCTVDYLRVAFKPGPKVDL